MDELFSVTRKFKTTDTKEEILSKLMELVKACQTKYGNKTELATEDDDLIAELCETWEKVFYHGLRIPNGSFFNLQKKESVEDPFWSFSQAHLTNHEKERFQSLHHVWTNHGKVKALIRAALNEHALKRYILMWLDDPSCKHIYESWAMIQDPEATHLLPSIAGGLNSILFAIVIDTPLINVDRIEIRRKEQVIQPEKPVRPSKKAVAVNREIESYDENATAMHKGAQSPSSSYVEEELPVEIIATVDPIFEGKISSDVTSSDLSLIDSSEVAEEDTKLVFDSIISEENETLSTRSRCSTSDRSTSSLSNDSSKLKDKVNELTSRCTLLEGKVADLILENQRLRNSSSAPEHQGLAFSISIPRVVLTKRGVKKYYAYEIHVNWISNAGEWITLKRYSQFYDMRKSLMKNNPILNVLDFPPKKKIGNMDASFVEERRQRLQAFLRHLVKVLPNVSSCSTLAELWKELPFLKI